jgi:hypothetical protein
LTHLLSVGDEDDEERGDTIGDGDEDGGYEGVAVGGESVDDTCIVYSV